MAPPSSLTARQAVGLQTAKAAAATAYYIGYMRRSQMMPAFDYMETIAEHYGGSNSRPTLRKSASDRPSYIVRWGGRQRLKPGYLGYLLRGAGFGVTQSGTGVITHAFTIANREDAKWLSVLQKMGEGAGIFERKAIDCRVTRLSLAGGRQEIDMTWDGVGLSEGAASGSETTTTEPFTNILPSTGSFTLTIGGVAVISSYLTSGFSISNPVSEEEVSMHTAARNDLPPTGMDITGSFGGVDFDINVYKKLMYGGTGGTAPSDATPLAALSWTFESKDVIPSQSAKYAVTVSVPVAELRMSEPVAEDNNMIRVDLDWTMLDTTATPITISLTNAKTNYTS